MWYSRAFTDDIEDTIFVDACYDKMKHTGFSFSMHWIWTRSNISSIS